MATHWIRTVIRMAATGFAVIVAVAGCAACGRGGAVSPAVVSGTAALAAPRASDTVPLALAMFPDITWKLWHGVRLPFTDLWGPVRVNGDAVTGFSHTPEGAVVAMMQHQVRLAGLGDAVWLAAARAMAVLAPADQPPAARVSTGFDSTGELPFVAGFQWISYTPGRAVADLALQSAAGALGSVRATEVWTGGDWKAELPAGGGQVRPLRGFDGYQPWPGTPR